MSDKAGIAGKRPSGGAAGAAKPQSKKSPTTASLTADQENIALSTSPATVRGLIRAVTLSTTVTIIALAISGAALWKAFSKEVVAVGISPTGSVVPLVTLEKPYLPEQRVAGFASECMRLSFSHAWNDVQSSLDRANDCYDQKGWEQFRAQIEPLLKDAEGRRMNLSVSVHPARVVAVGQLGDRYVWRLQAVLDLSFEGTRERTPSKAYLADIYAARVPLEQGLQGVKLTSLQLSPYAGK